MGWWEIDDDTVIGDPAIDWLDAFNGTAQWNSPDDITPEALTAIIETYQTAFARDPSQAELKALLAFHHGPRRTEHRVDPGRLAAGAWSHEHNCYLGEGDIVASYSGDRIGSGKSIRKPFEWNGVLWVCTSQSTRCGVRVANAYRLVPPDQFDGQAQAPAERLGDSEAARNDPAGFYHGVLVTHRGQEYVLCGPPTCFVPGPQQQLGLFDGP